MHNIKTIAMFLPQFHRTQENDKFWGDGYTDWVAVRKSTPLFEGHKQPFKPLNNNYYDLSHVDELRNHANLMKEYGIDALCFYHYYFGENQIPLSIPAENLLNNPDIELPFCFAWDLCSWARSWSNVDGNAWNVVEEQTSDSKEILFLQDLGSEQEWEKHFEYLLPFFKDNRYVKIDKKPILLCMKTKEKWFISMINYWQELSAKNGFPGIFIVTLDRSLSSAVADATLIHAPHYFWNVKKADIKNGVRCVDFDYAWKNLLAFKSDWPYKTYYQAFMGYDDTPRRGTQSGICMLGNTPEKFYRYMIGAYLKSMLMDNEILFFNAWNEWGEGMYLEPDEEHGYAYLESLGKAKSKAIEVFKELDGDITEIEKYINNIIETTVDFTIDMPTNANGYHENDVEETISELKKQLKISQQFKMNLGNILRIRDEDNGYKNILTMIGWKRIGVYGIGAMGRVFLDELERVGVVPDALIDKNVNEYKGKKVLSLNDLWPNLDAVIVTVLGEYCDIYSQIKSNHNVIVAHITDFLDYINV